MKKAILIGIIGIVVSAMLLTSPVLASAGYSKIYGNANEDDILDMRDVTYIKLVIFGKKPATTFADANYDGKISMLDIGQTKLIILGKEKKLTLVDMAERVVTLCRPVERVYAHSVHGTRTVVQLGAKDKLVAISASIKEFIYGEPGKSKYFSPLHRAAPELEDLPAAGSYKDPALEFILSLKPDVVLASPSFADTIQENICIPVVADAVVGGDLSFRMHRVIGKVVGNEKEAEELISYVSERLDELTEVTSGIPDREKPKVYNAHLGPWRNDILQVMVRYDPIEIAGGINVAGECSGYGVDVPKEQIIKWNPDIILLGSSPTKERREGTSIDDVLSDPDLQSVNAVKNGSVYYTKGCMMGWDPVTVSVESFYFAKLFHPEKFEGLNIEDECNEILKKFYGVDGLYTWMSEHYSLYRWE